MKHITISLSLLILAISQADAVCNNPLQIRNDKLTPIRITRIGIGPASTLSCNFPNGILPPVLSARPPFTIAPGATWTAQSFRVPYNCADTYDVHVSLVLSTGVASCETDSIVGTAPLVTISR